MKHSVPEHEETIVKNGHEVSTRNECGAVKCVCGHIRQGCFASLSFSETLDSLYIYTP